ncbi:ATP-binding response regulator [Dactylosporangium vinaceum]|uniref:histidine kinase n=2 Tax=Dactylosporangium vinaceum TaxID=53362 RepID=A0ABV5M9E7_9ACTN
MMATLMIVDDDAGNRMMLELLLSSHGRYRIVSAADGRQALAIIDVELPDLVITDALMPGLDGFQLTREIRRRPVGGDIPVLIFSGNYRAADVAGLAEACGANRVLPKPAEPQELFAAVDTLLAAPAVAGPVASTDEFAARHLRVVTDQLAATAYRLRLTEEQLQRIADAAPVGIVLTDAQGCALYANPALSRMCGPQAGRTGGLDWVECLPQAQRPAVLEQACRGSGPDRQELGRWQPRGSDRWLDARVQSVREVTGAYAGTVLVVNDVTAAVVAVEQEEADHRRRMLEHARWDRLDSLRRMASGVAHDFNNALASVLGYADLLQENVEHDTGPQRPADEEIRADLRQLTAAAGRARDLAAIMLRFGSRLVVATPPVEVNPIVRNEASALERDLPAGVTLCRDLQDGLPAARATAEAIGAFLHQTGGNAVAALPGGGVIRLATAVVDVADDLADDVADGSQTSAAPGPGRYVRVSVTDNGVGMPAQVLTHAVEPFFSTGDGRSGLGLPSALGAVQQVGGHLTLESAPGRGTSAHAYFPVAADPPPPSGPAPAEAPGGRTILVVDDEPDLLAVIVRMLRRDGYTVLSAADGPAALKAVTHHQEPIDCLLTDVVMPGMLGTDLAGRLSTDRPAIRVLYMSGYADPVADGLHAHRAPEPLLTKPFTRSDLRAALDRLLPAGAPAGPGPA